MDVPKKSQMTNMSIQRASVYKFSGKIVICPVNETVAGIGFTSEPYQVLPASASPAELGEAIYLALEASLEGIAHQLDWKAVAAPRLAAAGVKSEAAFQKNAELVTVLLHGAALSMTPHRNGGATGDEKGFYPIDEFKAYLEDDSRNAAGEAIIRRFEFCAR